MYIVHCTVHIQRVVRSFPVPLFIYIYVYFFIIGSLIHAMPLHWHIHFRIHVCICVCIRVCVIPLQCVKFSDNNKFSSRSGPMGNLWPFTARLHLNWSKVNIVFNLFHLSPGERWRISSFLELVLLTLFVLFFQKSNFFSSLGCTGNFFAYKASSSL